MRGSILPYAPVNALDMIKKDRTGSNNGNLLYQYSVIKNLMTGNCSIDVDGYNINPDKADEISEIYDAYILPLADAFRPDFRTSLKKYTSLINKLKIPVYVIGVGLRATINFQKGDIFEFDEDVKNFVKAVLSKSSSIGTRGEITSQYLTRLGFVEGKDHHVIGCPSMYSFGSELRLRDVNLKDDSLISINADADSESNVVKFISSIRNRYKNTFFIPQAYKEFLMTYFGGPSIKSKSQEFPRSIDSIFYRDGKVKFFLTAHDWFKHMESADLSIGTRLHGNIAATLKGTPNLTIIRDSRMMELAKFHKLPSIFEYEIFEDFDISNAIEKINYVNFYENHRNNFLNFLNFLKINNLESIYSDGIRDKYPMDELMRESIFPGPVYPITALNSFEKIERLSSGMEILFAKHDVEKKKLNDRINRISSL